MKLRNNIFSYGLLLVCAVPAFAHTPHDEKIKISKEDEQQEMDAAKANVAGSILGAAVVGVLGSKVSQIALIQDTGFEIGAGASSVLIGLSLFVDPKRAKALQSMAITAPLITFMGAVLSKDSISGNNGFFANHLPFGMGEIVKKAAAGSAEKKAAFLLLSGVGCYIVAKPYLDRFSTFVHKKSTEAYDYVASALN